MAIDCYSSNIAPIVGPADNCCSRHLMKKGLVIAGALVAASVAYMVLVRVLPSSVDYRGEKIKLTRFYFDYDDYKNDPDNIDPSETARVQQLVSEAPIAHSFATRQDLGRAVFEIKFPGYAAGGFGDGKPDSELVGFMIEIPRADKGRYFLFRKTPAGYVLLDDFLDSTMPGINRVEESGGNFIYSMDGRPERLIRPIRKLQ